MKLTLRIRSFADTTLVHVWLLDVAGAAVESFLFGKMLPQRADELVTALGLPVERELSPLPGLPHPDDPDEFYGPPPAMLSPATLEDLESEAKPESPKKPRRKVAQQSMFPESP